MGGPLAHLDGIAVEAGQDAVQAEHVAVLDERVPPVGVPSSIADECLLSSTNTTWQSSVRAYG